MKSKSFSILFIFLFVAFAIWLSSCGGTQVKEDLRARQSYLEGCTDALIPTCKEDDMGCIYDVIGKCQDKATEFNYNPPAKISDK